MKVGILGGGQLGQMLMLAAHPLGIGITAFEAVEGSPSSIVGSVTVGSLADAEAVRKWADKCDVVTYESENFPTPLVADISESRPVYPDVLALATTQDRLHEKQLFGDCEIPVAPFRLIEDEDDIETAISELALPVIFKTRTGGYDGKGQITYNTGDSTDPIAELLKHGPLVAEERLELTTEVSIIGVRSVDGNIKLYPLTENEHRQGILHKSITPANVADHIAQDAEAYIKLLFEHLEYVGVLSLELFVVGEKLLANEMAPRVHNSGHWTIEGAETSQFENHVRAIAGLPLGSTELIRPTAMVNLVGAIPDPIKILEINGAHPHLYGKEPRPGRKVGHITISADTESDLSVKVKEVEQLVKNIL